MDAKYGAWSTAVHTPATGITVHAHPAATAAPAIDHSAAAEMSQLRAELEREKREKVALQKEKVERDNKFMKTDLSAVLSTAGKELDAQRNTVLSGPAKTAAAPVRGTGIGMYRETGPDIAEDTAEDGILEEKMVKPRRVLAFDPEGSAMTSSIAMLVKLAGPSTDIKQRRQAALGFAQFSLEEEGQTLICTYLGNMGIQSLFRLVDTPDPVTVQNAVYAMGNIAYTRRWAKELMKHGALEAILEVFSSDRCDLSGHRSCAFAIANLAAKPHSHTIFRDYLSKVISLLDIDDAEVSRYVSLTLLNLSANPIMILPLIGYRCTSVLLNILVDEHALEDTRLNVVSCILNFVANHQLKLAIVAEGFVRELVTCAVRGSGEKNAQSGKVYADEPKVVTAVCAVLHTLSTLNDTHRALAVAPVLEPVFKLWSQKRALESRRHIAAFLANLTALPSFHAAIQASDGVRMIFVMLSDGDRTVGLSAIRGLANLALSREFHASLISYGAVKQSVTYLKMKDTPQCILFASLFVSIISQDTDCLVELCDPTLLQTLLFIAYRVNTSAAPVPVSENGKKPPEPLRLPVETIRYTLLALANLSAEARSHAYILEEIDHLGSAIFLSHAASSDGGCREYFTLLMANLVSSVQTHPPLLNKAFFIALEPLLGHPSLEPKPNALSAAAPPTDSERRVMHNTLIFCSNMLLSGSPARVLISTHMLDALYLCALSFPDAAAAAANNNANSTGAAAAAAAMDDGGGVLLLLTASILCDLPLSDSPKSAMLSDRRYNIAPVIQRLLTSRSVHIRRLAILCVARISELDSCHAALMSALTSSVLSCLPQYANDEQMESSALRVLSHVSSNGSMIGTIAALQPDHLLRTSVASPHVQVRKYAFVTLGNVSSHRTGGNVVSLDEVPVVACFMKLAADKSADWEEKMTCLYALCNAAFHVSNHPALSRMGIFLMKNVFDVVESASQPSNSTSSASAAAAMLQTTAMTPTGSTASGSGSCSPVLAAQIKRYASQVFANVCSTLHGHKMFTDGWMLSSMVKLARTANDSQTKLHAIHTLRCVSISADTSPIFVRTDCSAFILSSLRSDLLLHTTSTTANNAAAASHALKSQRGMAPAAAAAGAATTAKPDSKSLAVPTAGATAPAAAKDEKAPAVAPVASAAEIASELNTSDDMNLLVDLIREETHLLYHLTRHPEMAIELATKGVVPLALQLLTRSDLATKRLAYGVFANFARYERTQSVLVEQGTIYELVTHLEKFETVTDPEIEHLIGWTFTTMLTHDRCRAHLFRISGEEKLYVNIDRMIKLPNKDVQLGAILSLALALASNSTPAPTTSATAGTTAPAPKPIALPPHAELLRTLQAVCLDSKQSELIRKLALVCITNVSFLHAAAVASALATANQTGAATTAAAASAVAAKPASASTSVSWLPPNALLAHCPTVLSRVLEFYSRGDADTKRVVSMLLANVLSFPPNLKRSTSASATGASSASTAPTRDPVELNPCLSFMADNLDFSKLDTFLGCEVDDIRMRAIAVVEALSCHPVCADKILHTPGLISLLCIHANSQSTSLVTRQHVVSIIYNLSCHRALLPIFVQTPFWHTVISLAMIPPPPPAPNRRAAAAAIAKPSREPRNPYDPPPAPVTATAPVVAPPVVDEFKPLRVVLLSVTKSIVNVLSGMTASPAAARSATTATATAPSTTSGGNTTSGGSSSGSGVNSAESVFSVLVKHEQGISALLSLLYSPNRTIVIEVLRVIATVALLPSSQRTLFAPNQPVPNLLPAIVSLLDTLPLPQGAAATAAFMGVAPAAPALSIGSSAAPVRRPLTPTQCSLVLFYSAVIVKSLALHTQHDPSKQFVLLQRGILPLIFRFCVQVPYVVTPPPHAVSEVKRNALLASPYPSSSSAAPSSGATSAATVESSDDELFLQHFARLVRELGVTALFDMLRHPEAIKICLATDHISFVLKHLLASPSASSSGRPLSASAGASSATSAARDVSTRHSTGILSSSAFTAIISLPAAQILLQTLSCVCQLILTDDTYFTRVVDAHLDVLPLILNLHSRPECAPGTACHRMIVRLCTRFAERSAGLWALSQERSIQVLVQLGRSQAAATAPPLIDQKSLTVDKPVRTSRGGDAGADSGSATTIDDNPQSTQLHLAILFSKLAVLAWQLPTTKLSNVPPPVPTSGSGGVGDTFTTSISPPAGSNAGTVTTVVRLSGSSSVPVDNRVTEAARIYRMLEQHALPLVIRLLDSSDLLVVSLAVVVLSSPSTTTTGESGGVSHLLMIQHGLDLVGLLTRLVTPPQASTQPAAVGSGSSTSNWLEASREHIALSLDTLTAYPANCRHLITHHPHIKHLLFSLAGLTTTSVAASAPPPNAVIKLNALAAGSPDLESRLAVIRRRAMLSLYRLTAYQAKHMPPSSLANPAIVISAASQTASDEKKLPPTAENAVLPRTSAVSADVLLATEMKLLMRCLVRTNISAGAATSAAGGASGADMLTALDANERDNASYRRFYLLALSIVCNLSIFPIHHTTLLMDRYGLLPALLSTLHEPNTGLALSAAQALVESSLVFIRPRLNAGGADAGGGGGAGGSVGVSSAKRYSFPHRIIVQTIVNFGAFAPNHRALIDAGVLPILGAYLIPSRKRNAAPDAASPEAASGEPASAGINPTDWEFGAELIAAGANDVSTDEEPALFQRLASTALANVFAAGAVIENAQLSSSGGGAAGAASPGGDDNKAMSIAAAADHNTRIEQLVTNIAWGAAACAGDESSCRPLLRGLCWLTSLHDFQFGAGPTGSGIPDPLFDALLRLLQSSDRFIKHYSFLVLVNCILKLNGTASLDRRGLVAVFLHLLGTDELPMQYLCLRVLTRLLVLPKNRAALIDVLNGKGLETLVSCSYSTDQRLQLLVCSAFGELMELPRALLVKISPLVIPALTHLSMQTASPKVIAAAARTFFGFLPDTDPNSVKLILAITDNCLRVILQLLGSNDHYLRFKSYQTLQIISTKVELIPAILKNGGLQLLLGLARAHPKLSMPARSAAAAGATGDALTADGVPVVPKLTVSIDTPSGGNASGSPSSGGDEKSMPSPQSTIKVLPAATPTAASAAAAAAAGSIAPPKSPINSGALPSPKPSTSPAATGAVPAAGSGIVIEPAPLFPAGAAPVARWTWSPEDWARATTDAERQAMTRFASSADAGDSGVGGDEWGLTVVATILRNMCLRTDAHPAFVGDGGVDVLVRMIEVPVNRTIQRLAVAALADVIPYYTVKAIDDPKIDKQILVGALVSLLKITTNTGESDEALSVLSVDSLCRLCVVPAVQNYVCTSTATLDLLLARWRAAKDPLKLSTLSFFAKVADHPKLAHMLLERGGLDDIIALGHRQQLKFRTKVARLLCLLANKDGMRMPLAQRGGLKLLLALRSGAANDQKVKAYALEGVFAILENQEILAAEKLDSEIAQLMVSLSQIGGSARIKAAASAIVVRLAAKESGAGGATANPKSNAAAAGTSPPPRLLIGSRRNSLNGLPSPQPNVLPSPGGGDSKATASPNHLLPSAAASGSTTPKPQASPATPKPNATPPALSVGGGAEASSKV